MAQLREVMEIIKTELARIKKSKNRRMPRKLFRDLVKTYDISTIEHFVKFATDNNSKRTPRVKGPDMKIRKEHPGKFDVVFLNRHTKEKQLLTLDRGIPYDLAQHYYDYATYFGSEKYNELGNYEIVEHTPPFLPEEEHFGLS